MIHYGCSAGCIFGAVKMGTVRLIPKQRKNSLMEEQSRERN